MKFNSAQRSLTELKINLTWLLNTTKYTLMRASQPHTAAPTAAHFLTAVNTAVLPHCHTLQHCHAAAKLHISAACTATPTATPNAALLPHYRTLPRATHCHALPHCHTLPLALPHTSARTAAHCRTDCYRTLPRTAANCHFICRTLLHCHTLPLALSHATALPHIAAHFRSAEISQDFTVFLGHFAGYSGILW
jgi:hypothetical protein